VTQTGGVDPVRSAYPWYHLHNIAALLAKRHQRAVCESYYSTDKDIRRHGRSKSVAIEVITASTMTSDVTAHSARCLGEDRWVVSWLPGCTLTGEQAVTAMAIASTVAGHVVTAHDAEWAVLDDWALELGLTAREAIGLLSIENRDYLPTAPAPSLPDRHL